MYAALVFKQCSGQSQIKDQSRPGAIYLIGTFYQKVVGTILYVFYVILYVKKYNKNTIIGSLYYCDYAINYY